MFRYTLYIICIHLAFCYAYSIENYDWKVALANESGPLDEADQSKVVLFDVSEFLRKNDKLKRPFRGRHRKTSYEKPINLADTGINGNYNNEELPEAVPSYLEPVTKGAGQEALYSDDTAFDTLSEQQRLDVHNYQKGCAFKRMKIPFFSHDSPENGRQKRKKTCFNCRNKKYDNFELLNGRSKRSYGDLCFSCKNKFMQQFKKKDKDKQMAHNSRQYFQNLSSKNDPKETLNVQLNSTLTNKTKSSPNNKAISEYDKESNLSEPLQEIDKKVNYLQTFLHKEKTKQRRKRTYEEAREDMSERDRRLKELEEVERKVNNVRIYMDKSTKQPPSLPVNINN